MYSMFALFIPSMIGVRINNYFNKDLKVKNIIYNYITLLFFSFVINAFIMYSLFNVKENIFDAINQNTILFVQCAGISMVVNVIFVLIGLVIQKNVQFKVEVEKNEDKAVSGKVKKATSKSNAKSGKTTSKTTKKNKDK